MSRHRKFKNKQNPARRGTRDDAPERPTTGNSPNPSCTREVVQPSRHGQDPHRVLAALACRWKGGRFRQEGRQFTFTDHRAAQEFGYQLFVNRWHHTSRPATGTVTVGDRER